MPPALPWKKSVPRTPVIHRFFYKVRRNMKQQSTHKCMNGLLRLESFDFACAKTHPNYLRFVNVTSPQRKNVHKNRTTSHLINHFWMYIFRMCNLLALKVPLTTNTGAR